MYLKDSIGLFNLSANTIEAKECVEPETINTYTAWLQIESVPETTTSIF